MLLGVYYTFSDLAEGRRWVFDGYDLKINNYDFINAILYIAENECKWRVLPKEYGNWNSIYKRFNRWVNNGVIQRIFTALQQEKIISIKVEVLALDSTSCKVYPDGHGYNSVKVSPAFLTVTLQLAVLPLYVLTVMVAVKGIAEQLRYFLSPESVKLRNSKILKCRL